MKAKENRAQLRDMTDEQLGEELLKLRRIVLQPRQPSRYGALRREPRREALSTLEAAALTLAEIAGDAAIEAKLLEPFETLLRRHRESGGKPDGAPTSRRPQRRRR